MGYSVFIYRNGLKSVLCKHFQLTISNKCYASSVLNDNLYVQNIRDQYKIKEAIQIKDSYYSKGEYLVFDSESTVVLVNKKSEKNRSQPSNINWKKYDDISSLGINVMTEAAFLSIHDEKYRFAIRLKSQEKSEIESRFSGKFIPLRASLFTLSASESALVSQSYSLLDWHFQNNFCSNCGSGLKSERVGSHKHCSSCNKTHYPVISPVGITLVSNHDHSRALLVRQPSFPPGMFTCIAGFIEIGESVEENVRREVAEEVGLEVHDVEYMGSQHWAFPASRLMIACLATAQQEKFEIDRTELEDADWFTPQQIHAALSRVSNRESKLLTEGGELWVPPRGAIAHSLMQHWLKKYHSADGK